MHPNEGNVEILPLAIIGVGGGKTTTDAKPGERGTRSSDLVPVVMVDCCVW